MNGTHLQIKQNTNANQAWFRMPEIIKLIPNIRKKVDIYVTKTAGNIISYETQSQKDLEYIFITAFLKTPIFGTGAGFVTIPDGTLNGKAASAGFKEVQALATVGVGARVVITPLQQDGFKNFPDSRRKRKIEYITSRREEAKEKEKEKEVAISREFCEQMIIDMGETGKIWNVDENGKRFHLKDGQKIYEADIALDVCDIGTTCKNLIDKCLLRGKDCDTEFKELMNLVWKDPKTKKEVKIVDGSTYNVEAFPPIYLIRILYRLGFQYRTSGELNYIQSYDDWKNNVLKGYENIPEKKWIYDTFAKEDDNSQKVKLIKKIREFINANKVILNPKFRKESSNMMPQKPSSWYPDIKVSSKIPIVFMYGGAYERSIYNYSYIDPFQQQLGYSFINPNGSILKDSGLSGSNFLKKQWVNALNMAKKSGITLNNKNQIDNELNLFASLEKDIKQQILYTHEYVKLTKNTERGRDLKRDNISTRDIPDLKKEITMNLGELRKKETSISKLIANSISELGSVLKDKEEKVTGNSLSDLVHLNL